MTIIKRKGSFYCVGTPKVNENNISRGLDMQGYVARIFTSFADVPDSIATAVYFSGCSIRCKGCHNKQLWDQASGTKMTVEDVVKKIQGNSLAEWAAFLGGEPTDQMEFLVSICKQVKEMTEKSIALYTGREFEVLSSPLLDYLSLVVCGPYRQELHVDGWPASANQRVFIKKDELWTCL
jgi:anaerobic ribonucleoside-triphosphate reductase activating protein